MRESLAQFPKDDPRDLMFGTFTHAAMAATFVVETERWDLAEQLLPPAKAGETKAQTGGSPNPMQAYAVVAEIPAHFARGLAAAGRVACPKRNRAWPRCARKVRKKPSSSLRLRCAGIRIARVRSWASPRRRSEWRHSRSGQTLLPVRRAMAAGRCAVTGIA